VLLFGIAFTIVGAPASVKVTEWVSCLHAKFYFGVLVNISSLLLLTWLDTSPKEFTNHTVVPENI